MNTSQPAMMYEWKDIPWKKIERNTFKLQKRIYRASLKGDIKSVRKLQRLLMHSRTAKLLAVRKVTQDNQGKKTAGIDGVKALKPPQRFELAQSLKLDSQADPIRRVWIPKSGTDELRPLGIPTMRDRALQALVKLALEPEWETRFEANSYGFRPARSCHDAIEAIFSAIARKSKYVLEADIEKCFDRINHQSLLRKLNTSSSLSRQIKAWLKAGVMEGNKLFPTEEGTMQGGIISPLLANIALHGMEEFIKGKFSNKDGSEVRLIRYADDLVVLHPDLEVIQKSKQLLEEWLKEMGLRLKPSKTRITHTLKSEGAETGFDFLGFNIRQYPVGKTKSGRSKNGKLLGFKTHIKPSKEAIKKHIGKLTEIIEAHKHGSQERMIRLLNSVIKGWTNYYATVVSQDVFSRMGYVLFGKLLAWASRRHPTKGKYWIAMRYWRIAEGKGWTFQPRNSDIELYQHQKTARKKHIKVQGKRSPYDGDWIYWSQRLGRHPAIAPKVIRLLKRQQGKCPECEMYFKDGEKMEVDHIVARKEGGRNAYYNQQLLHRHCHDVKTARDKRQKGANDRSQIAEEPDESKECAAEREAQSLTESGEVRRNTSGPSDLPEGESQRGKEHVGEAGIIRRRL